MKNASDSNEYTNVISKAGVELLPLPKFMSPGTFFKNISKKNCKM